jgi:hypothetical protein
MAKLNDPTWCNAHPHRCAALRARAGGQPDQGYNGPPPGAGGPPPGYNGSDANGPPQNMQPPPQQH